MLNLQVASIGNTAENDGLPVFLNTKQVAQCLGCSITTARHLFYRRDFPALKIGKNYKVEKNAFEKWCRERRV